MKKIILSLLMVSQLICASDNSWSIMWPSQLTMAINKFIKEVADIKTILARVAPAENVSVVTQDRINQLFMNADLLLLKANHEAKDISKAIIKGMQPMGSKLIDETAQHVTIISHNFTVDLAQNSAKALLASTLGICGMWIVYHYLKAYLSVESHQDVKSSDVRWHERKLMHYKQHPSSKAAYFLLTRLKELHMVHTDNAQEINMQAVQGGTTLFALACVLCCYWIR